VPCYARGFISPCSHAPGTAPIDRGNDVTVIQHGERDFERRSFVAWSRVNVGGNNPLRLFDRVQRQSLSIIDVATFRRLAPDRMSSRPRC